MAVQRHNDDRGENSLRMFSADQAGKYLRRAELAEAQLAGVSELADVGIVVFNSSGDVELLNDCFVALIGADRASLEGARNWAQFGPALAHRFRDPAAFLERWRDRVERADEASWDELELAHPPGGTVERFGRPLFGPAGEALGRLEVYRDVSTKCLLEKKLLQTDKLAGLGQLVAGTVHELNNPLTGIIGFAQLLLRRGLAPQAVSEARHIYQEAERASRIIRNLLLFVREERTGRVSVSLNHIAEQTAALRSQQLRLENIRMDLDLDPALPAVIADAGQLQQVALNLVINAEQAIGQENSGGRICLRTAARDPGRVILEVSDTGPGIDPDLLRFVFDPFFTTKPAGFGTGLGLSVAFGIVHDHGGQLTVKSDRGQGSRFTIELAAAIPQPSVTVIAPAGEHRATHLYAPLRQRVLVIEDEPTVARFIADVLGEDGHAVDTLLNSRDGLARALKFTYDILFCDLKMPYPNGRDIYDELVRRNCPLSRRIIFMTGDLLAARTIEFLNSTGLPYLAKPFRLEDLKNIVADSLSRTRSVSETELPTKAAGDSSRRGAGTSQ